MSRTKPAPVADSAPWWTLALVGALGGTLSGAFGVGGGIVMVPLLVTLAKMDQRRAAATSLVAIVPASIAGSISYLATGRVDYLAAALLALGGIIGSWVGTKILHRISLDWLRWMFIGFLVLVAIRMFILMPPRPEGLADHTPFTTVALVLIGVVIGICSGLFGVGGGVIAVPTLMALFGLGDLTAKGTSLLMMVPTALSGSISNTRKKMVSVRSGLIVGAAATAFSFAGVALAFIMSPAVSAYLFAALLVLAAVQLTVRTLRTQRAARADSAADSA